MSSPAEDASRVTILAVDDEPLNNELIKRALRLRQAYRVAIVNSPAEGLEVLDDVQPDVFLVDYRMPKMTGIEFLRQALPRVPQAAAIMVTAYPELTEVVEAQKEGLVRHILGKPWSMQELLAVVDRAVKLREMNSAVSRLSGLARGPRKSDDES